MQKYIFYYFTICWNVFRAFDTSIADFRNKYVNEKRQDTVTIQKFKYSNNSKKLDNQQVTKRCIIILVGTSETIRQISNEN